MKNKQILYLSLFMLTKNKYLKNRSKSKILGNKPKTYEKSLFSCNSRQKKGNPIYFTQNLKKIIEDDLIQEVFGVY